MPLIAAKQVSKMMIAMVGVASFTTGTASSDTVTSALTTVLLTASNSGGSVPLQVGSATLEGVDVATNFNLTQIFIHATKVRLQDSLGNDVYAKISNAGAVWTVSYFSYPSGVETAYTFSAATSIDFEVPYWFTFDDLPATALIGTTERHVAPDPAASTRLQSDVLTVTALNTLSNLTKTPTGTYTMFNINGQDVPASAANGLTVSGMAVTVNPTNLGYNLAPGDSVTVTYAY